MSHLRDIHKLRINYNQDPTLNSSRTTYCRPPIYQVNSQNLQDADFKTAGSSEGYKKHSSVKEWQITSGDSRNVHKRIGSNSIN